jgi:hypothetical protein
MIVSCPGTAKLNSGNLKTLLASVKLPENSTQKQSLLLVFREQVSFLTQPCKQILYLLSLKALDETIMGTGGNHTICDFMCGTFIIYALCNNYVRNSSIRVFKILTAPHAENPSRPDAFPKDPIFRTREPEEAPRRGNFPRALQREKGEESELLWWPTRFVCSVVEKLKSHFFKNQLRPTLENLLNKMDRLKKRSNLFQRKTV